MPRLSVESKEQIRNLSHEDLCKIVIKIAAKEKSVYDFLIVNYLNKSTGAEELFEHTKVDLNSLFSKSYKGFSEQLQLANMMAACIRRINDFTKVCNNKIMEADLLMYVIEVPFSLTTNFFGTCFTQYDTKTALILKRLITVVTKHLHQDYRIEYQDKINEYLTILHRTSNHIDTVYNLPKSI